MEKNFFKKWQKFVAVMTVLFVFFTTYGFAEASIQEMRIDSVSISNVVNELDGSRINPNLDGAYLISGSTTITVVDTGVVMFNAYRLNRTPQNTYEPDYSKVFSVKGSVEVLVPDTKGPADGGASNFIKKTIDASEISNYEMHFSSQNQPHYLPNCSISLTEPGYYYVLFSTQSGKLTRLFIEIGEKSVVNDDIIPNVVTATPTSSRVLVNGEQISFDCYNINGNNYFKLRDLAYVVSGTEKQFEVTWDGSANAINLISNSPYTAVGGELVLGDGLEKNGNLNTSKIYKDGREIELMAYTINNNNYFKLRDIAKVFDIGITWDGDTNTIGIDTSIGYIE